MKYIEYLPKMTVQGLGSTSTDSGPHSPSPSSIQFFTDSRRPSWGTQRTWSTSILPLNNGDNSTFSSDSPHDSSV